ncbi:hypothetical protein D9613_008752 [Agrocybe pediades]|uniref:ABC transporter domain-containing protein n=1 Tax=Agrocybe pediades TaxID=84607 RepID=A0A8H4QTK2_9AGAR|nr:hypothetical protein D9613_008752 [Agrocybe pediades]
MAIFSKPIFPNHPLPVPSRLTQRPVVLAFLVLLLLRSRTLNLSKDALIALHQSTQYLKRPRPKKLNPEELAKVLQQVYVEEEDGSKTLLVPYRERVVKVPIRATPQSKFVADTPHFPLLAAQTAQKPNIDLAFISQLRAILSRIAIPSWRSSESGIVVLHSTFLILRTVLSILVARLDGRIVRDLVKADGKGFLKGLGLWFLLAIPSTFTNSMIRHFQSLLALRLRTRLTRYLHDLYLSSNPDLRYYRAPTYLEGVDQYLTADVEAWANSLSGVYGNVLKPSLDLLLFTSQLSRSLGVRGTMLLFLNYYGTVAILRAVTPAFGRLAAIEARLEGEYRAGMGRVGREAEEVAFYDGGARERDILSNAYMKLIRHVNSIYKIRIAYEWTEDYVIKYLWSAAGYALIAVPILYTRVKRSLGVPTKDGSRPRLESDRTDEAVAGRTETYISNRRLLLSLADAGGRLMYAYKDLLELAGLTTRLYTLISTLLNMPNGYVPLRIEQATEEVSLSGVDVRIPSGVKSKAKLGAEPEKKDDDEKEEKEQEEEKSSDIARHEDPPLVQDLGMVIQRGEHLMITGSNGVGKTAVARVLAGLWNPEGKEPVVQMPRDETEADVLVRRALYQRKEQEKSAKQNGLHGANGNGNGNAGAEAEAEMRTAALESASVGATAAEATATAAGKEHWRPRPTMYVVPQRSYMPVGSLLEQIIYPCSYPTFIRLTSSASTSSASSPSSSWSNVHGLTQVPSQEALDEIHDILEKVHLGYLVNREGGLHVRKEWRDVLSGGEKQRMAMARVLWWRPKWAVLDECTSAVSSDVEGRMYEAAKALDITLITISLRPSLMKYHKQLLTLHGPSGDSPGKWTLSRVGTPEERMSLQKEIKVLEEKLHEVEAWEKRVKELETLLGVQEGVDDAAVVLEEQDRKEEEERALREREAMEESSASAAGIDKVAQDEDASSVISGWSASTSEDQESEKASILSVIEDGMEEAVDPEEVLEEMDVGV